MLELLIGNIASGKSTYAKERVQEGWFCVNDDAIINMLLADQYRLYRRSYQLDVFNLMLAIAQQLVDLEYDVVVDSSWNVSRLYRQKWLTLFPGAKEIEFPREAPEVHARRRMDHDPRGGTYEMWLEVAKRIDSYY